MKNETKKTLFNINIDKDIKDRFINECKNNDTTAARELRRFIKDYLSKNNSQKTMFV